MQKFIFTSYRKACIVLGNPFERSWDEWCEFFSQRDVREEKDGSAIILGEITAGKKRSSSNVCAASAIGIDLDKLSEEQIEAAFEALAPYTYFVWTTHSHRLEAPRLRIVVPFDRPITPSDYAHAWMSLNTLIGEVNDPQTKDIGRLHYLPSHPPGLEQECDSWRNNGKFMALADLPDFAAVKSSPAHDPLRIRQEVAKLRAQLRVVPKHDPIKDLAHRLLCDEPLAASGRRHEAIRDITWWIAGKNRDYSVGVLTELFGGSLASMRQDSPGDSPSVEEIWNAYTGAVRKIADGEVASEERRDLERRSKAKKSQLSGGGAEYDSNDLKRIAEAHGWAVDELNHRWIIQREGMYWILDENAIYWGPFPKDDAVIVARELLARAPVRMMEITRNGASYRSFTDIISESGQVAQKVISDMIGQRTRYDPDTRILYEAVRPLRDLDPKYDEQIDEWLKLLAGPQYPLIIDWLSCVPDLRKLLCAIYLKGPKGSGKTLLPTGLARLWVEGPPGELELALSDFNDEIARCPLLLADEEMPRPYRTNTVTTKLRSMLSTMQRTLKRKFKPPTELLGAMRLIVAANNEFLLDSKGVSSSQDLEAIAQRFLYIDIPQACSDYMDALPKETRVAWMESGIARHTLWLRDNHDIKDPGRRFWVEGDMSQMHRLLMLGSQWNSLVCEWLVRYLMAPNLYDAKGTGLIRRGDGELLINDQAIIDGWELYQRNTRIEPETAKIGAALRSISSTAKRPQLTFKGQRIRYRVIDIDNLLAWLDWANIGDREDILQKLS